MKKLQYKLITLGFGLMTAFLVIAGIGGSGIAKASANYGGCDTGCYNNRYLGNHDYNRCYPSYLGDTDYNRLYDDYMRNYMRSYYNKISYHYSQTVNVDYTNETGSNVSDVISY